MEETAAELYAWTLSGYDGLKGARERAHSVWKKRTDICGCKVPKRGHGNVHTKYELIHAFY
jgi:hypothetical protein